MGSGRSTLCGAPAEPRGFSGFLKAIPKASTSEELMGLVAQHPDYLKRQGPLFAGGETALHLAAKRGRADLLAAFLRYLSLEGARAADPHRHTVLARWSPAERLSNPPAAPAPARHLSHSPADHAAAARPVLVAALDLRSIAGYTPLMSAAAAGSADCIKVLVQMGSDLWAVDCPGGRNSIHLAARYGHARAIEALIQAEREQRSSRASNARHPPQGPLVHSRTVYSVLPLHYAAAHGHADAVAVLLRHGSNPSAQMSQGQYDIEDSEAGTTALHLAALRGDLAVARLLLARFYVMRSRRGAGASHECGPDPRTINTEAGHKPYNLAVLRNRREAQLLQLLDPRSDLAALLPNAVAAARAALEAEQHVVPPLRRLAAAALAAALEQSVQAAVAAAPDRSVSVGRGAVLAAAAAAAAAAGRGPGADRSGPSRYAVPQPGTAAAPSPSSQPVAPAGAAAAAASAEAGAGAALALESMASLGSAAAEAASVHSLHRASLPVGGSSHGAAAAAAALAAAGNRVMSCTAAGASLSTRRSGELWCAVCLAEPDAERRGGGASGNAGSNTLVRIEGCGHSLCAGCASKLSSLVARNATPLSCPFCRHCVERFLPYNSA